MFDIEVVKLIKIDQHVTYTSLLLGPLFINYT